MAEECDLHVTPRDELLTVICDALAEGDENTAISAIDTAIARSIVPQELVLKGLVAGATRVGFSFGMNGETPAVAALQAGIAVLRPHIPDVDGCGVGTMVIGTIKGNGHDTGKDLAALMMRSAGFSVYDIGINNAVDDYLNAIDAYTPDVLGIFALRSGTLPYIRVLVEVLRAEGYRDNLIVLAGGVPLQGKSANPFGVDAYCCSPVEMLEAMQKSRMSRR